MISTSGMRILHRAPGRRRTSDQRGMAAIVITMITMVVISLIVIGFATISRREQRQSQDQLLSSQAFYAAESGIEDARSIIEDAIANRDPIKAKDACNDNNPGPGNNYPTGDATKVDGQYNVSYTCLKVNPEPKTLQYDGVADNSIIVPITTAQPTNRLEITWRPSAAGSGLPSADCPASTVNSFSPQAKWRCGYGVLRADIVPTAGTLTRSGLAAGQMTAFFQPLNRTASGTLAYGAGSVGRANIVAADCTPGSYVECKAIITGLNSTSFSLRLSSVYQPSRLSISALNNVTPQGIRGVQAVVDSTGKATDVLRRIQVRIPLVNTKGALTPTAAIQSNSSICKRFSVSSNMFSIPGDIVGADDKNAMCVATSDGDGGDPSTPPPPPPPVCRVNNDIMLVLDESGSMDNEWQTGTAMEKLKEVARRFVQTTEISADKNRAGIVVFSTDAELGVRLTTDKNELRRYIDTMGPDGDTYYLTGLNEGARQLESSRAGAQKVVVFVSDGAPEDDSDGNRPEPLADILAKTSNMKRAGIIVYTIGIDGQTYTNPDNPFNEQLLKDMSSGPQYYSNVNSEAELTSVLDSISKDLRCL